ncbi:MAG: TonB-dependent siderophore receptor, partial [Verrucomicrobiales bacterium]|nr:TonB-dependent siderophore receptor [Verrucomicrobiales bacterium]
DYTPGLSNTQGEGHRDAVVFRGVRSTADFYIDGVRDDVQYYRSLYNVERVEILRGPSALYFGRGGTGGIMNRVMKKPVIGEDFRDLDFSVDSFGANISQFDWNQSLSENFSFRLNTFYEYLNNHRDFFDGNRFGINPTLAIELDPDTRLDFSYEFNDHERFIDRGIPTGANGRPVSAFADTVFGDSELNESDFQSHTFRATLNRQFNDIWNGRVTAFYGHYDKRYQNFYASNYNQATDQVTIDGYVDTTARQNLVFSGDMVGKFDTGEIGHTVILGAEYINTSSDQNRFNSFWDTTADDEEIFNAGNFRLQGGRGINAAGNPATNSFSADLADDTRVNIETKSIFLQDEIALGDQWEVVVGARFDIFDIDVFNAVNGETRTRTDQEISPRIGVIYKPIENISIYGSHSESFLPRSGEQYANINGDNNALDPNTYSNLEAGINWDVVDDLRIRTAIFEIKESSPQVDDTDPSQLVVVDTVTSGFEFELTGYLTDRWFVSTGYTYLDGEQVDQDGPTGLRPRELPENMFSIWNKYQATDRFGVGLGVVYQDDSFIDNGNTAVLPDYTRVDAAAYYQLSDRTRLQLNIENLFDTEYYPSSHSTHQVTVGRPINAAFSIKTSF